MAQLSFRPTTIRPRHVLFFPTDTRLKGALAPNSGERGGCRLRTFYCGKLPHKFFTLVVGQILNLMDHIVGQIDLEFVKPALKIQIFLGTPFVFGGLCRVCRRL